MARFETKMKNMRQKLGLIQWQVADSTGVSSTYISALENGRKSARRFVSQLAIGFSRNSLM